MVWPLALEDCFSSWKQRVEIHEFMIFRVWRVIAPQPSHQISVWAHLQVLPARESNDFFLVHCAEVPPIDPEPPRVRTKSPVSGDP